MSKVRYKIRREQLERVVEHFVMESAMIEKNAAKKHKMSMGAEQSDDMGDGMIPAKEVKNPKMKQAPEVKKHIHGKVNESEDFVQDLIDASEEVEVKNPEKIEELNEGLGGKIKDILKQYEAKIATVLFSSGIASLVKFANIQDKLAEKGVRITDFSNPWAVGGTILSALGIVLFIKWISSVYSKLNKNERIDSLRRVIKHYGEESEVGMKAKAELDQLLKS